MRVQLTLSASLSSPSYRLPAHGSTPLPSSPLLPLMPHWTDTLARSLALPAHWPMTLLAPTGPPTTLRPSTSRVDTGSSDETNASPTLTGSSLTSKKHESDLMKYAVVSSLPDSLRSSLASNEIVESIGASPSFFRSPSTLAAQGDLQSP